MKKFLAIFLFPALLLAQFGGWGARGGDATASIADKHNNQSVLTFCPARFSTSGGTLSSVSLQFTANGTAYITVPMTPILYGNAVVIDSVIFEIKSTSATGDSLDNFTIVSNEAGTQTTVFTDATNYGLGTTAANYAFAPGVTLNRNKNYLFKVGFIRTAGTIVWYEIRVVYHEST